MRALQIWCARVTSGYASVEVTDLTSSFRSGLAFVGIIHHFRPDLIDSPDSLDPKDVVGNNALAYRVAEEKLEVPSLLDPEDMADCDEEEGPDKFSVVTYVSQFYHLFKDSDDSRMSPGPPKRFTSESSSLSSEHDSLLSTTSSGSSGTASEAATPLGTPTTARSAAGTPSTTRSSPKSNAVFNQAELIAKYGEEIFSRSSPAPPVAPTPTPTITSTPVPKLTIDGATVEKKKEPNTTASKVGALCSQLESKAKIRS